jgi:hypothetical protein
MAQVGPAEKYFVLAGLVFWFSEHKEAQQISANISARWEPDGIFAYHNRLVPALGIMAAILQMLEQEGFKLGVERQGSESTAKLRLVS